MKEPIIVTVPMTMTEAEANEYGNVNYETAKEDKNYSGKWYFYECLYEITNNATFKMPMTGDDGKWKYGFIGLIILMNWQMIGYMMIIYIAGLQNVPTELIEAAKIDGANKWQTLKNVTIPMVMPSITICLFLTLSNSFKLFDQNLALTNGAPMHNTEMLALNIVNSFYGRVGFEGVGQAKAVMFFVIVACIALAQLYYTRNKEVEQ